MKRILVCGLVPDVGGLEKIVVDFYNHIDTSEFELEFLLQGSEDVEFSDHFKKLCRNPLVVHRIPKLRPQKNGMIFLRRMLIVMIFYGPIKTA